MKKVINIDGKDVKFSINFPMFIIYRNTFGVDMLETIIPGLTALAPALSQFAKGDMSEDSFIDAISALNYFKVTDVINMLWASAKAANKDIPDVFEWISEFESFPVADIVKELYPIFIPSLVTTKKLDAAKFLAATQEAMNQ